MIGRTNVGGGSGGTGATLVVSAPADVTVTATKDNKTYTRVANSDGIATFKGLSNGTWALSMSDSSHDPTTPVDVIVTTDYYVTLAFFTATINITYPAGSTCKATHTDGTELTAPDTSGTWSCIVPSAGTWTVTATDGTNTKSESVEITSEGQSESVDLHYIFYIFKSGVGAKVELQTFEQANASVTIGTDSIKIIRSGPISNYSNIQTKELMPSALWNTIKIDTILTEVSSYDKVNAFGLAKSALSSQGDFDWVVYTTLADKAGTERVVLSCDIAAINADYIFGIGGSFNMEIFNIWLE